MAVVADYSEAFVIFISEQIDGEEFLQNPYIRMLADFLYQCLCNCTAGLIAVSMSNPGVTVATFERSRDAAVGLIELCTPLE